LSRKSQVASRKKKRKEKKRKEKKRKEKKRKEKKRKEKKRKEKKNKMKKKKKRKKGKSEQLHYQIRAHRPSLEHLLRRPPTSPNSTPLKNPYIIPSSRTGI
jgi:hypothetical protein